MPQVWAVGGKLDSKEHGRSTKSLLQSGGSVSQGKCWRAPKAMAEWYLIIVSKLSKSFEISRYTYTGGKRWASSQLSGVKMFFTSHFLFFPHDTGKCIAYSCNDQLFFYLVITTCPLLKDNTSVSPDFLIGSLWIVTCQLLDAKNMLPNLLFLRVRIIPQTVWPH